MNKIRGIGWILMAILVTVVFLQARGFSNTDVPIFIQIIGFVILIPTVTKKMIKIYYFFSNGKLPNKSYEHSLQAYAISLVILGYMMQTEFFNNLYLECVSKEICVYIQ